MVIISFNEEKSKQQIISNESFFLKGDNNLCFLIHGLTGTPKEMTYLSWRLHKVGYSVAVPLMEAHNMSLSVLKRKRWQEFYASIKEKFLEYQMQYEKIFVAGLSFGALLGILLAYEFPQKIKAVTCLSPTFFYDGWGTPKIKILLPLVYATPLKYYIYFKEEYPYGIKNDRLRRRIQNYYTRAKLGDYSKVHLYGYPIIPISCMYQNHLLAKYTMRILGKVNVPVQILQAKNDEVTSPKNSYYIYNRIASKDKEIYLFENSYHIITADQEREKVADKVISFFEKYK